MIKKFIAWLTTYHRLEIVIDFDGTITTEPANFPEPGRFKFMAPQVLRWMAKRHRLILNTCREGAAELLPVLQKTTSEYIGFPFINGNSPSRITKWGDCRKVTGDMGIDNLYGFIFWPWVAVKVWLKERGPAK
jgi:hypothetical protein